MSTTKSEKFVLVFWLESDLTSDYLLLILLSELGKDYKKKLFFGFSNDWLEQKKVGCFATESEKDAKKKRRSDQINNLNLKLLLVIGYIEI